MRPCEWTWASALCCLIMLLGHIMLLVSTLLDKFPSPNPLALHSDQTKVLSTDCRFTPLLRVFLIGVICSCREIYTIKASSVSRDVNIPYGDATVEGL